MLSGFLIWSSIDRSRDFSVYLKKRVFRIFPELWAAVILNAFIIILIYENIDWLRFGMFNIAQASFLQFWTPAFLREYGCGTPNGSLWTICVILQFYLVAWFIKKLINNSKNRKRMVIYVFVGSVLISFLGEQAKTLLPSLLEKLYYQTLIPYFWVFMLGICANELLDKIISILKKAWFISLLLLIFVSITGIDYTCGYPLLKSIFLTAWCIGFAYKFPKINIKPDISYGMYLYHMIVANVFIEFNLQGKFIYFIFALGITIILAVISYYSIGFIGRKRKEMATNAK